MDRLKRLKIALYALKEQFDPSYHKFFLKNSWIPEDSGLDRQVVNTILPNPLTSSDFLVYNHKKKIIHNIHCNWVEMNPNDPTRMDGTFRYSERDLKALVDDHLLYNNILLNDGSVLKSADKNSKVNSYVMFFPYKLGAKPGLYASKPVKLDAFIKPKMGFEKREHAQACKDALNSGKGYLDTRPYKEGSTIDSFKLFIKAGGDKSGFVEHNSSFRFWQFPWQLTHVGMRTAAEQKRLFPIKLSGLEEINSARSSIADNELNLHVGIAGAGDDKHKTLKTFAISPESIQEIYERYMKEAWDEHKLISQFSSRKAATLNWLKEHYVDYPLFPGYSWFQDGSLRFCHKAML